MFFFSHLKKHDGCNIDSTSLYAGDDITNYPYPGKLCNSSSFCKTWLGLQGTVTPQKLNNTAFFFWLCIFLLSYVELWGRESCHRSLAGRSSADAAEGNLCVVGPPTHPVETLLLWPTSNTSNGSKCLPYFACWRVLPLLLSWDAHCIPNLQQHFWAAGRRRVYLNWLKKKIIIM